jgi:acetyltransferase-like isoleucine patch superfamily enzyme
MYYQALKKLCYSKFIPRFLLRFLDDLLLLPAMWLPGNFFRIFFNRLRGVKIGKGAWIGYGSILGNHPFLVSIGNNVIISPGAKILTHDTSFTVLGGKDLAAAVRIGDNVQIGENAVILPGVTIADRVIVGAASLVNTDIPADSISCGVPAKVIRSADEGLLRAEEKIKSGKFFSAWRTK